MAIITKLQDFNLLDILQLISMGNRSAVVRLRNEKEEDKIVIFCHGYLNGILPCNCNRLDSDYKSFINDSLSSLLKGDMEEYEFNSQLITVLPNDYLLSATSTIKQKFLEFLSMPPETEAEILFRNDWDQIPLCIHHSAKSINLLLDCCKYMASNEEISNTVNEHTVFVKASHFNTDIELDTVETAVYKGIDGITTVGSIAEKLGSDKWEIIKTAYNLSRAGAIIYVSGGTDEVNATENSSNQYSGIENKFFTLLLNIEHSTTTTLSEFIEIACSGINEVKNTSPSEINLPEIFQQAANTNPELEFFDTSGNNINYKDFIENLAFFNQEDTFDKNLRKAMLKVALIIRDIIANRASPAYQSEVDKLMREIETLL